MKDDRKEDRRFEMPCFGSDSDADDERLSSLLQSWQEPGAPASLDARVVASYRRQPHRPPVWKRVLTATIPVPAPVAAAFAALLLASTFLAVRLLYGPVPVSRQIASPPVQTTAAEVTQDPRASATGAAGLHSPPAKTETGPAAAAARRTRVTSVPRGERQFTISLDSSEETIQIVTGSDYRLNPSPKIYAGAILNRPPERQMP